MYHLILFVGGILSGLYGSTVGSGSLVSFPLVLLTGVPVHTAIATNRCGVVLLDLASSIRYAKEGKLNLKLGIVFGVVASIGSFIGSNIVIDISERYLSGITALLLVAGFVFLFFKSKLGVQENALRKHYALLGASLFFALGIYGGFFGAVYGTLSVLTLICIGFDFVKSAAISRVAGFMMSLTAAVVFAWNGLVHFEYALSVGAGQAVGAWIGAGIGVKKGNAYIRALFIAILVITIGKLLFEFLR